MVPVIIATHGEFSSALLGSANMIFGNAEDVVTIAFLPGQGPEDLLDRYAEETRGASEALFLVDLFGGSPYNAAARFVAERQGTGFEADIVTGVNLPMLIEVLAKRSLDRSLGELVDAAQRAGRDGIRSFGDVFAKQPVAVAATDDEGDEL